MQNDVSDVTQEHGFQRFMRERQVCRDAGNPKTTSEVKQAFRDEIGRLKSEVEKLGNICHTEMVNALNAMEFTAGKSRVADLIDESGKNLSEDELDDFLNDIIAHPSVQQRLPNAILGAWSHMREPQVSHSHPFLLHCNNGAKSR